MLMVRETLWHRMGEGLRDKELPHVPVSPHKHTHTPHPVLTASKKKKNMLMQKFTHFSFVNYMKYAKI